MDSYSHQYAAEYPSQSPEDSRKRSWESPDSDSKRPKTQQPQRRLNKDGSEKPKLSRGSRACLVCRKVKMRCIGAGPGVKCKRCQNGGHDCVFEESNRGRRSTKKPDQLNQSLTSLSDTLSGVLKTLSAAPGTPQTPHSENSEASTSKAPIPSGRPALNAPTVASLETLINGSRQQQLEAAAWLMQFQESLLTYNNQILEQNSRMVSAHPPNGHPLPPPNLATKNVTPLDQLVNAFQASSPRQAGSFDKPPAHTTQHSIDKPFDKAVDKAPQRASSPKLHSLPDDTLNPLGLLAEASLNNRRYSARNSQRPDLQTILNSENTPSVNDKERNEHVERMIRERESEGIGVASDEYYKPGPMSMLPLRRIFIERQIKPEILTFCSDEDVGNLFEIFYRHMNIHTCVLDEGFHTPALVATRSPFLLTAVCAVASKYYTQKPELQGKINQVARKLAFDVPSQGFKSVEIVMAYLILVYWGVGPSRRFEEDKTWLLLGLALRVATDLNLHKKSTAQSMPGNDDMQKERELRCRERVWILCYITDRSLSSQMGKPPSTSHREDYIIRHVSEWARNETGNPEDYCVAAYCELQRIVSRCIDFLYSATTPSGLSGEVNYMLVTVMFESQLVGWFEGVLETSARISGTVEQHEYIVSASKFMFNYWSLAVFSFGLQSSLEGNSIDTPFFFAKCYHFAVELLNVTKTELAPKGWLKYSVDSHFVFITYAAVSLLKFMRPQFIPYHTSVGVDNGEIIGQVSEIASLLAAIAVDAKHTPALYAAFLQALIGPPTSEQDDGAFRDRNEIFGRLVGDDHDRKGKARAAEGVDGGAVYGSSAGVNGMDGEDANTTTTQLIDDGTGTGSMYMPPPTTRAPTNTTNTAHTQQPHMATSTSFNEYTNPHATFEGTNVDYMSMDLHSMHEQAQAMDALYQNGFWENVLLPGFGGPLDSISGGVMRSGFLTPKGVTPAQTPRNGSRPQTPGVGVAGMHPAPPHLAQPNQQQLQHNAAATQFARQRHPVTGLTPSKY